MNSLSAPIRRRRACYALLMAVVIGSGLLWRSGLLPLTNSLSKYGGDALWALMVFLGFGFIFPRTSTARLALAALGFAWTIEFLQLYHAPWLDSLRATRPGHLILGSGFNAPDLLAYLAGIALGAAAECLWNRKQRQGETRKAAREEE